MRLALRKEIRALEDELIKDGGFPSSALMETAGRLAAADISGLYPGFRRARVACGRGNNGGDGFVVARCLREAGWDVRVQLVGVVDELAGDPAKYAKLFRWCGGAIEEIPNGSLGPARDGELQVDALLGTGLDREIEGAYAAAIDALNNAGRLGIPVYAIDIPSGLDADSGQRLGDAVQASATGTFGLGKPGLFVAPGAEFAGRVAVLDIGFPQRSIGQWAQTARYLDAEEPLLRMPQRSFASHKGTYGHLLVFAGGPGKGGAADLACRGAIRGGAGLVTLCSPGGERASWPEVMHAPLSEFSADTWSDELVFRKNAMVFGPGVGTRSNVRDFFARACATNLPLAIDADGLNILAEEPGLLASRKSATLLTPHPAEAARLLSLETGAVQSNRVRAARDLAERFQAVVVLKGARTVIGAPDGRFWVNSSGSPAQAAGGMGDVLAGLAGALLAGGMPPEKAACIATYAHGRAGEAAGFASGGLRASEVADRIPAELEKLAQR